MLVASIPNNPEPWYGIKWDRMSVMNPVEFMTLFNRECIPLPGPPDENIDASLNITWRTVMVARKSLFYPMVLKPRNIVVEFDPIIFSRYSPPT